VTVLQFIQHGHSKWVIFLCIARKKSLAVSSSPATLGILIVELDFNALRELLAAINQTDIADFTLKSGDFELVVRKGVQQAPVVSVMPAIAAAALSPPAAAAPAPAVSTQASPLGNDKLVDITAPMVGTFYRAPGPDEPAFVEKGDRIRAGQTVCIIEAMKLMNELEAEVAGEVVEVLAQNGQPVEFGQVLMRINPG
jgi:acetyl-CoA carboxylase biotin carboxyl carrier protein